MAESRALTQVDEGEAQYDRSAAVSKKSQVSPRYPGKPDGPCPKPDTESSLESAPHPVLPDTLALPPLPPGKPLQQRHITIFTFGLQNWAGVPAAHVEHDMLKRIFKSRGKEAMLIFSMTLGNSMAGPVRGILAFIPRSFETLRGMKASQHGSSCYARIPSSPWSVLAT